MSMTLTKEIQLQPFNVPNYVLVKSEPRPRQEGFIESPKYHLSELDVVTLEALCERFKEDVFKKAGKG
jgi:hypothetical protein